MFRWAVLTQSGKNLRIYQPNRLKAIQLVKQQTGEKVMHIEPAGFWDGEMGAKPLKTGEQSRITMPDWDASGPVQGWPGGPSGRPR